MYAQIEMPGLPVVTLVLLCAAGRSLAGYDLLPSDGSNANGMVAHSSSQLKSDAASTAVTRYAMVSVNARIAQEAADFYRRRQSSIPSGFTDGGAFGDIGAGPAASPSCGDGSRFPICPAPMPAGIMATAPVNTFIRRTLKSQKDDPRIPAILEDDA